MILPVPDKRQILGWIAACWLYMAIAGDGLAQTGPAPKNRAAVATNNSAQQRKPTATATIHWSGVALREAVARLKKLYPDAILVDRRIDPNLRIDLDLSATSTHQVLNALATGRDMGVVRLRNTVYLGPAQAAKSLSALIKQRSLEITRLPKADRATLVQRRPLQWERLSDPQKIVALLAQTAGWQISNSDGIPFDLWDGNSLPELSFAESLSLLLINFDVTFELHPDDRTIQLIPIANRAGDESRSRTGATPMSQKQLPSQSTPASAGGKQVFTLRVQEKPVGVVLRELARRLNWTLQIDEAAIQAAGKSLDTRVSFSVENADREKLLTALLSPASLEYRVEGGTIYVTPERYGTR